jgi:ketosteroid isomerase-like protein
LEDAPMTANQSLLADRDEIVQLKNRYGQLVDRMVLERRPDDADQVRNLFTEDAIVDMSFSGLFGVYHGHDEIVKLFVEVMTPNYHWMWHSFHTPVIEVIDDRAFGFWTIHALMLPKSAEIDGQPRVFYGRYADIFSRTAQGWKHSHLKGINDRPKVPAAASA